MNESLPPTSAPIPPQQPLPAPEPARSSRRGCFLAAALLAVVVVAGVIFLMISMFAAMRSLSGVEAISVSQGSVLEISLVGPLPQAPPAIEMGGLFGPPQSTFWGLRRALRRAAGDSDISGVLLRLGGAGVGWATAEEILEQLDAFRASGKPIYALLRADMITDLDYFLATGADRIWVTPYAGVIVNGLASEAQFYRGSLDKLKIEPQVIMFKEYKSAGEAYANYEMSSYMRESIEGLLSTFSSRFSAIVTERRGISAGDLETFLARGVSTTQQLLDAGLVDDRGFLDDVHNAFEDATGRNFERVSLTGYLTSLGPESRMGRDRIAVVFGEGAIVTPAVESPLPFFGSAGFSGPIVARNVREAAADPRTKAIILRVDSPGGAVVGSNLVLHEVKRAQAEGIPVVVSMADTAASGGYWVSMSADSIVAQPTTVTGSIGVVFQKFNLDGFYEWLGVNTERITTDQNATIFNFSPWDEEDREKVMEWMDSSYRGFTEAVAEGRGLPIEKVQEIARGRVWSGIDALEVGLVDELGGFEKAVEVAAGLADLGDSPRLVVYPRPKTFFEQLSDLQTVRTPMLPASRAALIDFVEELAEPRVEAIAPDLDIH